MERRNSLIFDITDDRFVYAHNLALFFYSSYMNLKLVQLSSIMRCFIFYCWNQNFLGFCALDLHDWYYMLRMTTARFLIISGYIVSIWDVNEIQDSQYWSPSLDFITGRQTFRGRLDSVSLLISEVDSDERFFSCDCSSQISIGIWIYLSSNFTILGFRRPWVKVTFRLIPHVGRRIQNLSFIVMGYVLMELLFEQSLKGFAHQFLIELLWKNGQEFHQ